MSKILRETLGWYGVIAILSAYILVNFAIIKINNPLYLVLNITGSIGLIFDAWHQKNYQPVVLNIIWALVGLVGALKLII